MLQFVSECLWCMFIDTGMSIMSQSVPHVNVVQQFPTSRVCLLLSYHSIEPTLFIASFFCSWILKKTVGVMEKNPYSRALLYFVWQYCIHTGTPNINIKKKKKFNYSKKKYYN